MGSISQYLGWHIHGEYLLFLAIFVFATSRMALVLFTLGVLHKWQSIHYEDWYAATNQTLLMEVAFDVFLVIIAALIMAILSLGNSITPYVLGSEVFFILAALGTYFVVKSSSIDAIAEIIVSERERILGLREFGITRAGPRTHIVIHWKSQGWQWCVEKCLLVALLGSAIGVGVIVVLIVLNN